jgi:hypothetical protein
LSSLFLSASWASWGSGYTDNDRVFAREDCTDLSPGQVTKVFGRLTESAGLRPIRLHDLRHGAASLMLAGGVDLGVVSKRMGQGVGRQAADAAEALVPARTVVSRPPATTLRPHGPENDKAAPSTEDEAAGQMRAACRNRTDDLLITSEMLYRLS